MLARSGGSIFEIAAAARPSILVPYPYASGRHQHANAEWMAAGGRRGGDRGLRARARSGCARWRTELLADAARLEAMGAAAAALARPDAAERIAAELLGAIGNPVSR